MPRKGRVRKYWDQEESKRIQGMLKLSLLIARYKGIKERRIEEIDREWIFGYELEKVTSVHEQSRQDSLEEILLFLLPRTAYGAPKLIAFIPFSADADVERVRDTLLSSATSYSSERSEMVTEKEEGPLKVPVVASFPNAQQRFQLLTCTGREEILRAAMVADIFVFVKKVDLKDKDHIEPFPLLNELRAQALPGVVAVYQGLETITKKSQAPVRKAVINYFDKEFGPDIKIADASSDTQLFRAISLTKAGDVSYRSIRSYFLADGMSWEHQEADADIGTLKIRAYVRGKPIDVNDLVHIVGAGAFRIKQIDLVADPIPIGKDNVIPVPTESDIEMLVQSASNVDDDLELEATPDPLQGDQTWPDEDELFEAEQERKKQEIAEEERRKATFKDFEEAWLLDDTEDIDEEFQKLKEKFYEEEAKLKMEEKDEDMDDEHDYEELRKKEGEELEFPDEVETPLDTPARIRFARYRSLRSFRTSEWDPNESLPREYGRIFRFENFKNLQKRTLRAKENQEKAQNGDLLQLSQNVKRAKKSKSQKKGLTENAIKQLEGWEEMVTDERVAQDGESKSKEDDDNDEGEEDVSMASQSTLASVSRSQGGVGIPGYDSIVCSGVYLQLHIMNFKREQLLQLRDAPLVGCSLLPYENKLSVLHFNVVKYPGYKNPLKSKENLVIQCGFRRFTGRVIFSQNNLNSNKHKFERFLYDGRFSIASAYGPVTFQPCPVLIYRKMDTDESNLELVATGTLLDVDPDRVIVKRILLTGHAVKVHKKKATIRYMFYNPEDIKYFKPAELHTKFGLLGFIREPIGTHGSMKCYFNKPIKQHDTVCMALYKRIYPKMDPDLGRVECL